MSQDERLECTGDTQDSDTFVHWINQLALVDQGYSEPIYIWKHGSRRARLDRFLATTEWIDEHPLYEPSSLHFMDRTTVQSSVRSLSDTAWENVSTMRLVGKRRATLGVW